MEDATAWDWEAAAVTAAMEAAKQILAMTAEAAIIFYDLLKTANLAIRLTACGCFLKMCVFIS